jgi:hypothetical protein
LPIFFSTLKLVLPDDCGAGITANSQTGIGTRKIALKFNYYRNKGGCVYSFPCCITHLCEVSDSHWDAGNSGNSLSWRRD